MKFYAQSSQPIYLSHHLAPAPPLRQVDVYYDGYPKLGFSVVGSSPQSEAALSILAASPDAACAPEVFMERPTAWESWQEESEDLSIPAHRARDEGELERPQPMHVPPQEDLPPQPRASEAALAWLLALLPQAPAGPAINGPLVTEDLP